MNDVRATALPLLANSTPDVAPFAGEKCGLRIDLYDELHPRIMYDSKSTTGVANDCSTLKHFLAYPVTR